MFHSIISDSVYSFSEGTLICAAYSHVFCERDVRESWTLRVWFETVFYNSSIGETVKPKCKYQTN